MKVEIMPNNSYKYNCYMILPTINFWNRPNSKSLFFGWLLWGFNIEIYDNTTD